MNTTQDFSLRRQFIDTLQAQRAFERLKESGLLLDTLSMGMSHDLEAAVAEGASIVRVGTAIFGARSKS